MPIEFFFFNFLNVPNFHWAFYVCKIKLNSLSAFVILFGLWSAGCKYLTKHHSKHLLSSIVWILIKSVLGWFNSFGNSIQMILAKTLYFEILKLCSLTESIIQPEPFPKDFSIFDITVLWIDLTTLSSMSLLLKLFLLLSVTEMFHIFFYLHFGYF